MKSLTKNLHWILAAVFGLWFLSTLRPKTDTGLKAAEFGKLPVLLNGRIQPWDSVARNSLLQIRDKQSVSYTLTGADGKPLLRSPISAPRSFFASIGFQSVAEQSTNLTALQWMMEVMFTPDVADARPVFRIDHPDVKGLLGLSIEEKHFAWKQLEPSWPKFYSQATNAAQVDSSLRSPYDRGLLKLLNAAKVYLNLKASVTSPQISEPLEDLLSFMKSIGPGRAAALAQKDGKPDFDEAALNTLVGHLGNYDMMANLSSVLVVPPHHPERERDNWAGMGATLMDMARGEKMHNSVMYYAAMASGFREGNADKFNKALGEYQGLLAKDFGKEAKKGVLESFYNQMQPFYSSNIFYVVALLLGLTFWIVPNEGLRRSAVWLIALGLVIHTTGLVFRMVLEGRPPVTNLYSSAIFIGWGSVILGLFLERFYRDAIGIVVASFIGFVTLIVAHNLSLGGDTMEMMRAVLDTNFWLATHVVIVTLGYAATFVAGFLAIVFIFRGFFSRDLSEASRKAITRMTYAILCFATLFSFVGTVLGGIWADQSWGRFWGWDPKENGALMIVLWNALILHARWGGLVKERGLAVLAVAGNIITAWSWFGTNMLGVGLHSYGFTDSGFKWLMLFITSQLLIIIVGVLPLKLWASFAAAVPPSMPTSGKAKPSMA